MSTKSYHNVVGDSTQKQNAISKCDGANNPALIAHETPKPPTEVTRYQQHHLPWNRISKPKLTLRVQTKPSITANIPDLDVLARQVWGHLKELNESPFLFRREGKLYRVEEDDNGTPVPVIVDARRMSFTLAKLIDWTKEKGGEIINVRPPNDLAQHLIADPDPPVPILRRIVTAP